MTFEDLEVDAVINSICSKQKLQRDEGIKKLIEELLKYKPESVDYVFGKLQEIIQGNERDWEMYHGALEAFNSLIVNGHIEKQLKTGDVETQLEDISLKLLTHDEVRVRDTSGKLLGNLCLFNGGATFRRCSNTVFSLIENNLERENSEMNDEKQAEGLTKTQIFHDTAGWKNLETSMKCLEHMAIGCGSSFSEYISKKLVHLVFSAIPHTNRFVRETAFMVCGTLASCKGTSGSESESPMEKYGTDFSEKLGFGLSDNWSQVRLASSVATRKFLLSMPLHRRETYFEALLPKICLNRYYVAEGVRLYSQESWELITERQGLKYVEKHLPVVVAYYIKSTKADNHAVREASCAAIAELGRKLSYAMHDHVKSLLPALIECFQDDSWPVRDAACLACGLFVKENHELCSEYLVDLYPLCLKNLEDNIPSVREGAATTISIMLSNDNGTGQPFVDKFLNESLKGIKDQPEDSKKYSNMDLGPAVFGVVKQMRDNDVALHSDNTLYSCGSLAPKMGRGGCSDCRFQRPTQPWEKVDGCARLLTSMCEFGSTKSHAVTFFPRLAEACHYKHYSSHVNLLETLCKSFSRITSDKAIVKRNLQYFYDLFFYALHSQNALTSVAATNCLKDIASCIGPGILKGRLKEYNPRYLEDFERISNAF